MIKEIKLELIRKEISNLEGSCSCHINPPCDYCIKVSEICESYDLDIEDLK